MTLTGPFPSARVLAERCVVAGAAIGPALGGVVLPGLRRESNGLGAPLYVMLVYCSLPFAKGGVIWARITHIAHDLVAV